MHKTHRVIRSVLILLLLLLSVGAGAMWMILGTEVPVPRLIQNVGVYVREHPQDAQGYYVLGRVHSLAFAQDDAKMRVYYQKDLAPRPPGTPQSDAAPTKELPQFPGYASVREGQNTPSSAAKKAEALAHLLASVRNYQCATQLAPKTSLYWLGLGWMLEQADQAQAHGGPEPSALDWNAPAWRVQALAAYQRAYDLSYPQESKQSHIGPGAPPVSLEAGEGMLRLMQGRTLTPAERAQQAQLLVQTAKLNSLPRAVTPIIFPLRGQASLAQLLDTRRTTLFDLAGDGRGTRWPWVTPDTGILVWDPGQMGKITSGRQLFGSATWWMFFQDGYEALAALDNNHDGQLTGRELEGIAVWQDRNGNGVCDPGEVVSLFSLGITSIAIYSAGKQNGVLSNPRGLQCADGTFLPTYDWTPTSQ